MLSTGMFSQWIWCVTVTGDSSTKSPSKPVVLTIKLSLYSSVKNDLCYVHFVIQNIKKPLMREWNRACKESCDVWIGCVHFHDWIRERAMRKNSQEDNGNENAHSQGGSTMTPNIQGIEPCHQIACVAALWGWRSSEVYWICHAMVTGERNRTLVPIDT